MEKNFSVEVVAERYVTEIEAVLARHYGPDAIMDDLDERPEPKEPRSSG